MPSGTDRFGWGFGASTSAAVLEVGKAQAAGHYSDVETVEDPPGPS